MKFSVVAAVAVVAVFGAAVAAGAGETNVYDFLAGDWDYTMYKTPLRTGDIPEALDTLHVAFAKRNGSTTVLDGRYVVDDDVHRVQVNFVDQFTGEYLVEKPAAAAKKDDDDENELEGEVEFEVLFKFSFVNVTAGHFVSQGAFGAHGAYQAVISAGAAPSFAMTVYELNDADAATEYGTVLAKKVLPPRQPSFFQKYGLALMMGVMMLMNFSRARNQQPQAQQPRRGAAAAAAPADGQQAAAPAAAAAAGSEGKKDQ